MAKTSIENSKAPNHDDEAQEVLHHIIDRMSDLFLIQQKEMDQLLASSSQESEAV